MSETTTTPNARETDLRMRELERCLGLVAAGELNEGLRGLLSLVKSAPADPRPIHGLGLVTAHTGDLPTAERLLTSALSLAERADNASISAIARVDLATVVLRHARNLEDRADLVAAEAAYHRLVAIDPDHKEAWTRLLRIALAHGNMDAIAAALAPALRHFPIDPDVLVAAAEYEVLRADVAAALGHLRIAIAIDSVHRDAGLYMGALLARTGQLEEAIAQLQRTTAAHPSAASALTELQRLNGQRGHHLHANSVGQRADALHLAKLEIQRPIINLIHAQKFDQARAAIDALQKANRLDPNAALLRGVMLDRMREPEDASAWYGRAYDLDPDDLVCGCRWATRLASGGAIEASNRVLDRLLLRSPEFSVARVRRALTLPPVAPDLATLERSRAEFEQGVRGLLASTPPLGPDDLSLLRANFFLGYQGGDDRPLQEHLATYYKRASPGLEFEAPHVRKRTTRAKLRVGLLSAFFSRHIVSVLYRGIIERLDRQRFEVILIHSADGSFDATTKELDAAVDGAVYLPIGLLASQKVVADLELDILMYPDIGMSHENYFLAFGRYARVQCTSWGHPMTAGLAQIDYFISSKRLEVPHADAHYSEKLVRFNNLPCYYHSIAAYPELDRAARRLSEEGNLYGCLQSLFKMHPSYDAALAGILRADPNGTIIAITDQRSTWADLLRARWAREMPDVAHRIRFVPMMDHPEFLSLLSGVDVAIDTYPFAGGNTSLQAIGVGTPLVTLPSEFMRGRCTYGAYDQIGYHGLIARDVDHYVELAVRTANDRAFRADAVDAIKSGASRIFETQSVIDEFNDFFVAAYEAS